MNNLLFAALLGSICIGCGSRYEQLKEQNKASIDSNLQEYVTNFEADLGARVEGIKISLDTEYFVKEPGYVGVCSLYAHNGVVFNKTLRINTAFYNTYKDNKPAMEQLMYHELGHCVLNLLHDNSTLTPTGYICNTPDEKYGCRDGLPISIMRFYVFSKAELANYEINRDTYIQQLKSMIKE